MIVGIVGSEAAKFTVLGATRAKEHIKQILSDPLVEEVVSGHCHLGGIDIWAEELGQELGKVVTTYPPAVLDWQNGYKPRNIQIARRSHVVYCIAVRKLPPDFRGGIAFSSCYHCHSDTHVKSGGCWANEICPTNWTTRATYYSGE